MRRFQLFRRKDVSGMSGTGLVAEGVQFADGKVVMRWLSAPAGTNVYDAMAHVRRIHGHGGKTLVLWVDEDGAMPETAAVPDGAEPLDELPAEAARPAYGRNSTPY